MELIRRLVVATAVNVAALAVTAWVFTGVHVDGWGALIFAGIVFGVVNTVIKPVVTLLALPVILLSLGIALYFVNMLMLALTDWVVNGLVIDGFGTLARRDSPRLAGERRPREHLRHPRPRQEEAGARPLVGEACSSIRSAPPSTWSPAATWTVSTVASNGDVIAVSIFIASSTTSGCRASTVSPAATATLSTVPGIGAVMLLPPCSGGRGLRLVDVGRRARCRRRQVEPPRDRQGPGGGEAGRDRGG